MPDIDIQNDVFRKAILDIERRAERQLYDEKLVRCFVPNRVLEELNTNANQLLFGRRGVGKTHTFKAYLSRKITSQGQLCHYIDCTSFGSGLGSDGSPRNIGIRFFAKFLSTLTDDLLEDATLTEKPEPGLQEKLQSVLLHLSELAAPNSDGETFQYAEINKAFCTFLDHIAAERLTILIDEWAQIPKLAQPFFAEFLKRSVFATPRITTKIGVVDYTYKLMDRVGDNVIGLERSADIFTDVRMDRYFVWDQDEKFVEQFFAEVLYNHLALELNLPLDRPAEEKIQFLLNLMFTQRRVLSDLCRASEGNARDFLVLCGKAHTRFRQQTGHQKIGLEDVNAASIELYRGDKYSNISTEKPLEDFLNHLVHSIIRDKRSRTFMVRHETRLHPLLCRLYSARILHPLDIEWSHPHEPGERYSLITMDYGTYVSFRGTKFEPEQSTFWSINDPRADELELVPIDDRRSIRRIVVAEEILNEFWAKMDPIL